ncbi:MAG: ISL3 family transposase [Chloroflexota bacterium]|nr:ISL3 family transposase [Chloroflexota bacterium]
MARKNSPTLLPDTSCLQLVRLEADEQSLMVIVATTSSGALCPLCQCRSESIHSRYTRVVADLPWAGWAVRLKLHVRRFFCRNQECKGWIFTERLPNVVAPSARRTTRLCDLLTLIGFAMGGEAGNVLVERMGLEASPETLLRLVRQQEERQVSTPRVLGVDDFCFCRRRSYGAILIDLERHLPIDLLPDREAETFKKWLLAHPGVQIISRDRGGAFAEGARQGAPKARQIADRWHLLSNLSDAMQGFFLTKQPLLKSLTSQLEAEALSEIAQSELVPWHTGTTKCLEEKSLLLLQQRVELYHQIHDLAAKKVDVANIARQIGVSRQTVYNYLQMKQPPERTRIYQGGKRLIDPYKDYLARRWNEGCRSAQLMYREIKEQGYSGSDTAVGRFVAPLRAQKGKARSFKSVEPEPETMVKPEEVKKKRPPTALQVAHWMTFKEDQRLDWQQTYLTRLCEEDPQIAQTYELIQEFTTMLRELEGERFDVWLDRVETQGVSELQSFAKGLKKDYDAVKAGLTLEWSQGQTEGQVHRLKLIKRQMYGRGSFKHLRKRVLHRAETKRHRRRAQEQLWGVGRKSGDQAALAS